MDGLGSQLVVVEVVMVMELLYEVVEVEAAGVSCSISRPARPAIVITDREQSLLIELYWPASHSFTLSLSHS